MPRLISLLSIIFAFGALCVSTHQAEATERLDRLRRKHAADLAALQRLVTREQTLLSRISTLSDRYARECPSANEDTPPCSGIRTQTHDANRDLASIRESKRRLEARLRDFRAAEAEDALLRSLDPAAASGNREEIARVIRCLHSQDLGTAEAGNLYSQALLALSGLDQNLAYELMAATPGYRNRRCSAEVTTECWEFAGHPAYVTKGRLRVSYRCLMHSRARVNFPTDPRDYVAAADQATERISGCLARYNPSAAQDLAMHISTKRPALYCDGNGSPDGAGDSECAHTSHGSETLYLTNPLRCDGLAGTVFHELMHAGSSIDNLRTVHHNDSGCHRFDAIYACAELCFSTGNRRRLERYGCERCVTEERLMGRACGRFRDTVMDNSLLTCTGGGP